MKEKLRAINPLLSGITAKTIASQLRIGKSTDECKKNQAEIEKWYAA